MQPIKVCVALTAILGASSVVAHTPHQLPQNPLGMTPTTAARDTIETGVGHFSEWSRNSKKRFLIDWQKERTQEWVIVQGNEGGDLDSLAAAMAWAYHLEHSTENSSQPIKAIALLQTPADALDLRPENKLALENSRMSSGHWDLLTINELPEDPETLSRKIKGIVIVDHPQPLRKWSNATILSIIDHHVDRHAGPDADPRTFSESASCTSLVARQMLDELEALPQEYHLAHELLELMLGAIAIDSDGLEEAKEVDLVTARRIFERSNWRNIHFETKMKDLGDELKEAKKDLDHLGVRDLLRRDWKGDLVDTPSERTPTVSLGFASIPYSLDEQIEKTGFRALFDWFAVEAAWTAQVGADISVALNKYKTPKHAVHSSKKVKRREIVLVVRSDVRITEEQADNLFRTVARAIEEEPTLNVTSWHRCDELGHRQMVWQHDREDAGRKVIRPIIEKAVMDWK